MKRAEQLKKFDLLCNYYIELTKEGLPSYMFKEVRQLEDNLFKDEETKKELEVFKMVLEQYLVVDSTLTKGLIDLEKVFIEQLEKMKQIICS